MKLSLAERSIRRIKKELARKVKRWQSSMNKYTQIAAHSSEIVIKGEGKNRTFFVVQYKSGAVSCSKCLSGECGHVNFLLKKGAFDKDRHTACLIRRKLVVKAKGGETTKKSKGKLSFG